MTNKIVLSICFLFSLFLLLSNCTKECTSPLPLLQFEIQDANHQPLITKNQKDSVRIYYTNELGVKTFIEDLRFGPLDTSSQASYLMTTHDLINSAHQNPNASFSIKIAKKVIGTIQLQTYQHNTKCDSWIYAKDVMFNNKPALYEERYSTYILRVE